MVRPVRGSTTAGKFGFQCPGRSAAHGASRSPNERPRALRSRIRRRFSLMPIGASLAVSTPAAMALSIWPAAIFRPSRIAVSRLVPQARCRSKAGVCASSVVPSTDFARQVEVARVLQHRAGADVAEALAGEPVLVRQRLQRRRQHLLVAAFRVGAHRARERDAGAADDGDATGGVSDEHVSVPVSRARRSRVPVGGPILTPGRQCPDILESSPKRK